MRSQTVWSGPNQRDPFYLLTVEVQDLRVPGSLSDPGTFQGPGEAAALLAGGSSMVFEGQQSPLWPLALSSSLGNRPLDTSLSWRLTCPSPLLREAPFKFMLPYGSQGQTVLMACVCRPFLSQQGEQVSLCLSLLSTDLPRTALGGKARGCLSPGPQSTSPDPWGVPCPLLMHFCWVDLPPVAPLTELWSVGCGALSAMHTVASRGSWWGESGAEAGWDESNGFGWGSWVTSCRVEWVVERESQGPPQSVRGEKNTIRWAEIKAEWHKAACTCTQRERKTEERTEAEIERKMYTIIQFNTTSWCNIRQNCMQLCVSSSHLTTKASMPTWYT